ncbi:16S rRNA (cytidine(1402)-2'-O)-methyltransferase [Geminicoccaceae bacterium 1502E]|nr:16S rRNA (cytidine(1402)-2'-O)-methyltransferase [Geminicoccaceae bacterium 1502E]
MATPIGNLGDLSPRAREVLASADLVACEDTRVTGRLLHLTGARNRLQAYNDHNAPEVRPRLLAMLAEGKTVALVSDAGTPCISDPGYKLVREAVEAGAAVHAVPGPSAVLAALSVAGLPTDRFLFAGFLPSRSMARRAALAELAPIRATLVFLEAAPRLVAMLAEAAEVLGGREAAVMRELTKLHEEGRRGPLAELAQHYAEAGAPKGEIVVVVGPPAAEASRPDPARVDAALREAARRLRPREAAAEVAAASGLPANELYRRLMELKNEDRGD